MHAELLDRPGIGVCGIPYPSWNPIRWVLSNLSIRYRLTDRLKISSQLLGISSHVRRQWHLIFT